MIRTRVGRLTTALLAIFVALAFAVGCQSSPEAADDSVYPEPTEEPGAVQEPDPYEEPRSAEPHAPAEPMTPPQQGQADVPASPADVTDDQVEQFASAYVEVMDVRMEYEPQFQAATQPEEVAVLQQRAEADIIEIVENHDMSVEEFNTIADFLAYDEGLRMRIQAEVDAIAN